MHRVWVAVATATLMLVICAEPSVSAAVDWRAEVPIDGSDGGRFTADASYRDKLSVIAWQISGDATEALRVAISRDAGRGAFATRKIADGVVGMAVAACGESAFVAYRERLADGGLRLRLARIPSGGGSIARILIRPSVPARGTLDLACGSGHATVVWTERADSIWHALVSHVRLSDLARTQARDLGVAHRGQVATAASGERAYVAWSDASGLRFKRFVIGAGTAFGVTARPTQRLNADGREPVLAADGKSVVAGYTDWSWAWMLTSRDRGSTFPLATGNHADPGSVEALCLAVEGQQTVVTLMITYGDHPPDFHRLMRPDFGARWKLQFYGPGVVRPLDGFLVARTGTKLAETYVRADGEAEGWELVFRRER